MLLKLTINIAGNMNKTRIFSIAFLIIIIFNLLLSALHSDSSYFGAYIVALLAFFHNPYGE